MVTRRYIDDGNQRYGQSLLTITSKSSNVTALVIALRPLGG